MNARQRLRGSSWSNTHPSTPFYPQAKYFHPRRGMLACRTVCSGAFKASALAVDFARMESDEPAKPISARDLTELLGFEYVEPAPMTPEEQAIYDAKMKLQNVYAETMQVLDQMNHPDVLAAQKELDEAIRAEARSRGIRDTAA